MQEEVKSFLEGYSWKFEIGQRVRLKDLFSGSFIVRERSLHQDVDGAFGEIYGVRRLLDGVILCLSAEEIEIEKK
jgi:hypothetical protein